MTVTLDAAPAAAPAHRSLLNKLGRHAVISVGTLVVSQALLALLVMRCSGVTANMISVVVTTIPAYLVNRRWVWDVRSRARLVADGVPFWLSALIGFVISTWAVAVVERHTAMPLVVNLASMTVWGSIWLCRFAFLELTLTRSAALQGAEA